MRLRNRDSKRQRRQGTPEVDCDHEWSKFGVCIKCGFKTPTFVSHDGGPLTRSPDVQTTTAVFEIDSLEELGELYKRLRRAKKVAPVSLRYTVAVTARRIVIFRGNNGRVPNITERIED